jgi:uridine phosphorylase
MADSGEKEAKTEVRHEEEKKADPFFTPVTKLGDLHNANFPMDAEGRVYHLGVKRGEVANRILSVGDAGRANLLSTFLDDPETTFHRSSSRGFVIHTGKRNGVPISIIATGMGLAMIDFVIRECRAVVDGPMVIVRFGTCGTPQRHIKVGSIAIASKGSICVQRKYDAFTNDYIFLENKKESQNKGENEKVRNSEKEKEKEEEKGEEQENENEEKEKENEVGKGKESEDERESGRDKKEQKKRALDYYNVSRPVPADPELSSLIERNLRAGGLEDIHLGLNVSADSFYSSQGRVTDSFDDYNETLIDEVLERYPEVATLEMETFHLFHMAQCSRGKIRAAAATIVLAQRKSGEFLDHSTTRTLERLGGTAALDALSQLPLPTEELMHGPHCVWEQKNKNTVQ